MGDVLSLVERAQRTLEEDDTQALEKKIREATFDLEDFLKQLQQVKKMGPLSQVLELMPGFSQLKRRLPAGELDEGNLKRIEALIYSMTLQERRTPEIINGSRRRRIAKGSGTTPQDVNQLLNQFRQMQKLMRQLSSAKGQRRVMQMFR
jgi:signal recognition particle subunit SRP54